MPELRDLAVEWISLVKRPANRRALVLRAQGQQRPIAIQRMDAEMMRAYGIVYAPDDIDSQGDWASANTIRRAADRYMREGLSRNVDSEHNFRESGHYVAESWLVRAGDALFPNEKPGAWAVGIQLTDPIEWAELQAGTREGLSLAGSATFAEPEKSKGSGSDQKGQVRNQRGQSDDQKGQGGKPKGTEQNQQGQSDQQKGQTGDQQGQSDEAPGWARRLLRAITGATNDEDAEMTKDEMTQVVAEAAKAAVAAALAEAKPQGDDGAGKGDTAKGDSGTPAAPDAALVRSAVAAALAPIEARLTAMQGQVDGLVAKSQAKGAAESGGAGGDDIGAEGWL